MSTKPTEAEIQALRDSILRQTGYGILYATAFMALQDVQRVRESNPHGVKVGQVWQDNDARSGGRQGRVLEVTETHARVEWYSGTSTKVRLDRFKPTSTGYRLIKDVK